MRESFFYPRGFPYSIGLLLMSLVWPQSARAQKDSAPPSEAEVTCQAALSGHEYLEEVEGERALAWVRKHNERTLKELQADPQYEDLRQKALSLLNSPERIPYATFRGKYLYNFWTDEKNPRGILRRTTLDKYREKDPEWELVLDIDALNKQEGANWVYHGGTYLRHGSRVLMSLSAGGSDSSIVREFDLHTKQFVKDGFQLPAAKSHVQWIDENTILVATDFGEGSLTDSGYPRIVKKWKRGTPLSQAVTLHETDKSHVAAGGFTIEYEGVTRVIVEVRKTFFTAQWFFVESDNRLTPVPVPEDCEIADSFQGNLILSLKSDWNTDGGVFPAGALVEYNPDFVINEDPRAIQLILAKTATTSIQGVAHTKDTLFVPILDHVRGQVLEFRKQEGRWVSQEMNLPKMGSTSIGGTDEEGEWAFINYEDFLTPSTLYLYSSQKRELIKLKALPAFFDASNYKVEQFFATSKDGTKVPYFVVARKDIVLNGKNPTEQYGYGGFEISLTPSYSAFLEYAILRRGGVYVLANIRGGGEYGPQWHQAALREHRQRAYDDFAAVSEDVIRRGYTSSKHLIPKGGSNGGLLAGVAFTQRHDLYNGSIVQVPLLAMLRFHKLLAGASWVEEYGSPEDAKMKPILAAYSPYDNIKPGVQYPVPFFMTSTKDDRVHPGHARMTAAQMEDLGLPFYYYENTEGGHGGNSDNTQRARWLALEYTYFWKRTTQP